MEDAVQPPNPDLTATAEVVSVAANEPAPAAEQPQPAIPAVATAPVANQQELEVICHSY